MKKYLSKKEIIKLLQAEKDFLKNEFGVLNIGVFGSYAKDQQNLDSDIDFLVELSEPRFDWLAGLQVYMEKKFNKRIELVRKNDQLSTRFLEFIEKEVIYA